MSVKLDAEDLAVNEAVARITGLSRKFFTEVSDVDEPMEVRRHPLDAIAEEFQPSLDRTVEYVERPQARGDNADYQPVMPKSKAQDSQKQMMPKQKMAPKKPTGDMYGVDDQDSNPETISLPKKTAEHRMARPKTSQAKMESFVAEYLGSMDEFRYWSGLPQQLNEGETGPVPTDGVNKDNKSKGGLPGLQGQALQDVEPEDGPPGDEDGTDKEQTLDQTIAMLKKEGIDTEDLWAQFLEQRGLSTEVFGQLVDEAMESNDADEMDSLLAVEGLFLQMLPQLLPEGLMDMFRRKKAPEAPAAMQAKDVIKKHGMGAVRAANAHGMSVEKMGKTKPMPTSVGQAQREIGSAVSLVRKPKMAGESKGFRFEANDDELDQMVSPRDYRASAMESMMSKYGLGEGKFWIAKATKNKGKLHAKLGVPQGKKIPAKKLAAAAHSKSPIMRKEASLAKTLKKFRKK